MIRKNKDADRVYKRGDLERRRVLQKTEKGKQVKKNATSRILGFLAPRKEAIGKPDSCGETNLILEVNKN